MERVKAAHRRLLKAGISGQCDTSLVSEYKSQKENWIADMRLVLSYTIDVQEDAVNLFKQLLAALPKNRDWLDPELERTMRGFVATDGLGYDRPEKG